MKKQCWPRKLTGPVTLALVLALGVGLTGCAQPPPKPVVAIPTPAPPPPPDPAVLHKAFEAGYAAGYAEGKKVRARLAEQLRGDSQDASCAALLDNSAMQMPPTPAPALAPLVVPPTVFQPAGKAVPLSGR